MPNNAGNQRFGLAFLLFLGSTLTLAAEPQSLPFNGEARAIDTSEVLYTEHHKQTGHCSDGNWLPESDQVTYRNPEGKTIAEKTVDYGSVPERPGFVLEDRRFGQRVEVRNRNDKLAVVHWRAPDGEEQRFETEIPENGVIDAGFEVMVRQHWQRLVAEGKATDIRFFAPTRGAFYGFEAEPTSHEAIDAGYVFRISKTGWIASWFLDPFYLGFNDQQQLTDFRGMTNILEDFNDNHIAHIHYFYPKSHPCR